MGLIDKLGEAPADDVVKSVIRYVRERRRLVSTSSAGSKLTS